MIKKNFIITDYCKKLCVLYKKIDTKIVYIIELFLLSSNSNFRCMPLFLDIKYTKEISS